MEAQRNYILVDAALLSTFAKSFPFPRFPRLEPQANTDSGSELGYVLLTHPEKTYKTLSLSRKAEYESMMRGPYVGSVSGS